MRVLIVAARFPEYGQRGDQLRTRQLIDLLAPDHDLHVVSGGRPSGPDALRQLQRVASVTLVHAGPLPRAVSALTMLARGRPAEVGWMTPRRLQLAAHASARESDVVITSTLRVVTEPLPAPLILDHIDALSASLRERAGVEHASAVSVALRIEARLLARYEATVARWSSVQIAVSDADAALLPQHPRPLVIPHVVSEIADTEGDRDIDVILTGNMGYPPNTDAARWLVEEILPELRRLRPRTRIVVAGRRADRLTLPDVEVAADVSDISVLLRRARVAIVPLRSGTGVSNKLLEAAAAGAAVAATTRAARAAGIAALTADDARGLAAAVARLLDDDELRASQAARARGDLARRSPSAVGTKLAELLALATSDTAPRPASDTAPRPASDTAPRPASDRVQRRS